MPVIAAIAKRLKQKDHCKFRASLVYIVSSITKIVKALAALPKSQFQSPRTHKVANNSSLKGFTPSPGFLRHQAHI